MLFIYEDVIENDYEMSFCLGRSVFIVCTQSRGVNMDVLTFLHMEYDLIRFNYGDDCYHYSSTPWLKPTILT